MSALVRRTPAIGLLRGELGTRLQVRRTLDLPRQIGRRIDQEPARLGNGSRKSRYLIASAEQSSRARGDAVRAGTIPLRKAATGGTSKNTDAN